MELNFVDSLNLSFLDAPFTEHAERDADAVIPLADENSEDMKRNNGVLCLFCAHCLG